MREIEYPPLLASGFKDIPETDLYSEFVSPFNYGAKDHRNNLLLDFVNFLNEFKTLNLNAEIWIDGSFITKAPDPDDVDVVFYFDIDKVEALDATKRSVFEKLFKNRKFIKNVYKVEVFYGRRNHATDYAKWQKDFGTCYDNSSPKGIFRLIYK